VRSVVVQGQEVLAEVARLVAPDGVYVVVADRGVVFEDEVSSLETVVVGGVGLGAAESRVLSSETTGTPFCSRCSPSFFSGSLCG